MHHSRQTLVQRLADKIGELTPRDRELLHAFAHTEGTRWANAAAKQIGMTPVNARVTLTRIKDKLRPAGDVEDKALIREALNAATTAISVGFDVFVSYSSNDAEVVHALAEQLRNAGLKVWLDTWQIRHGDSIPVKIETGLQNSRTLLLCMSANTFGSDWPSLESFTFRFRDPLSKGRRFLPVRLDDAEIKGSLAQFKYVDWRYDPKPIAALVEACRPPADATTKRESTQVLAATSKPSTTESSPKAFVKLRGHNGGVNAVAMSPDGRRVVSAADDQTLRVWDAETGECTRVLEGHTDSVRSIAWDPDGRRVGSGSADATGRIWEAETGECTRVLEGHAEWVQSVAWAPDGRRVVSGSDDMTLRVWDAETGECTRVLEGHAEWVQSVAWAPDGRRVVSGSDDMTLRVWDAETGACTRVLEGHTGLVLSVAWAPDGRRVVSGSNDRTVRVWDAETGACTHVLEGHAGSVLGVAWDPDGRRVVSGSNDRAVRVWDAETGACTRVLEGHTGLVLSVAWDPDGRRVVSGSTDKTVRLWHIGAPDTASSTDTDADIYTNAKVLLVGDSGVGKSGLARYLAQGIEDKEESPLPSTDGAWATQWSLATTTEEGVEREIWLWDFAGQGDYRLVQQIFMRDTGAVVLVFDPQDQAPFDGLAQWDADLCKSTDRPFAKHLAAARIDRGGLIVSDKHARKFIEERGYHEPMHKTSARTGAGCDELKRAIVDSIDWQSIPIRTSPALYRRLKREIIQLRDEGIVLIRLAELKQRLDLALDEPFEIEQLTTVIGLLDGPGMIRRLDFGEYILLRPEVLSRYAAAAVRKVRKHPMELGCINERDLLAGDLDYQDFERLPEDDEQVVLRAMLEDAVGRAWCLRQPSDDPGGSPLLAFPSYFRRERTDQPDHPSTLVTYRFEGLIDAIYATLVVRLHHTHAFDIKELWRNAADFVTEAQAEQAGLGITLTREGGGRSRLEVYFEPGVEISSQVVFLKYVHAHLESQAKNVERLRDYSCRNETCRFYARPFRDRGLFEEALANGDDKVYCPMCREPIHLIDVIEEKFESPETLRKVQEMREEADFEIDSQSRELIAVHHAGQIVAEAGQIYRPIDVADHGLDAEIEFKDDTGKATGQRLYLQLKLGDSYLRTRQRDEAEIFRIKKPEWAAYWQKHKYPVMLVVRTSDGEIRWMDVSEYLRRESAGGREVKQVEFEGERMDVMSVRRWRKRMLER